VIENVRRPPDTDGDDDSPSEYLQLQYIQTAMLNFEGMSWPHVTVGTLIKAF